MAKSKTTNNKLTLNIKGKNWLFILLPDRSFDKQHNSDPEEEPASAITIPSIQEVHFRKTDLNPNVVAHELLHVLVQASLVGSASLSPQQVEELCCEIVGEHYAEIALWVTQILTRFMHKE